MERFKIAGVWYHVPGDPRLWWLVPQALFVLAVYSFLTWMANIIIVSVIGVAIAWVIVPTQHVEILKDQESVARLTDAQTQEIERPEEAAIQAPPQRTRALPPHGSAHAVTLAPKIHESQVQDLVRAVKFDDLPPDVQEKVREWMLGKRKSDCGEDSSRSQKAQRI